MTSVHMTILMLLLFLVKEPLLWFVMIVVEKLKWKWSIRKTFWGRGFEILVWPSKILDRRKQTRTLKARSQSIKATKFGSWRKETIQKRLLEMRDLWVRKQGSHSLLPNVWSIVLSWWLGSLYSMLCRDFTTTGRMSSSFTVINIILLVIIIIIIIKF